VLRPEIFFEADRVGKVDDDRPPPGSDLEAAPSLAIIVLQQQLGESCFPASSPGDGVQVAEERHEPPRISEPAGRDGSVESVRVRPEELVLFVVQRLQDFQSVFVVAVEEGQDLPDDGRDFPAGDVGVRAGPGWIGFDSTGSLVLDEARLQVRRGLPDQPVALVVSEKTRTT